MTPQQLAHEIYLIASEGYIRCLPTELSTEPVSEGGAGEEWKEGA